MHAEYREGNYERVFTLSDQVDGDRIDAVFKDGVLRLTLPKATPSPAKKIAGQGGLKEGSTMNIRDLIPWSRSGREAASCAAKAADPMLALQSDIDRVFEDFWRMLDCRCRAHGGAG